MWNTIWAITGIFWWGFGLVLFVLQLRSERRERAEHEKFLADADAYIKVRDDLLKSLTDHASDFHEHGEKAWH